MRTRSRFPNARTALLIVDVISPFDFDGAKAFVRRNLPVARAIAHLRGRATRNGVPVIYVNDNFGRWRSDIHALVARCSRNEAVGRPIVELLAPRPTDFIVLKSTLSGFYQTALDTMLRLGGVRTVILTKFAADNCVLFTAADAYMCEYRLIVPRDCVGAESNRTLRRALATMTDLLDARTDRSTALRLSRSRG